RLHKQKQFVVGDQPIKRFEKNILQPSLVKTKGLQSLGALLFGIAALRVYTQKHRATSTTRKCTRKPMSLSPIHRPPHLCRTAETAVRRRNSHCRIDLVASGAILEPS